MLLICTICLALTACKNHNEEPKNKYIGEWSLIEAKMGEARLKGDTLDTLGVMILRLKDNHQAEFYVNRDTRYCRWEENHGKITLSDFREIDEPQKIVFEDKNELLITQLDDVELSFKKAAES